MHTTRLVPAIAKGAALGTALLLSTPLAQAQEIDDGVESPRGLAPGIKLSLRLEPGLATALTAPQSDMTDLGFGTTVKLMVGLNRYLAIGPSATFTTLPAVPAMTDSGTAWALGGGARLMRPHDAAPGRRGIFAASTWIDADLLYVRTGDLDRLGFAAAVGVAVPLDDNRRFWLGPYARYSQILQGERVDYDNHDAKILTVGLALEMGTGLEHKRDRARLAQIEPEPVPVIVEPAPVLDRDGDGVIDGDDSCPDVAGLADNAGCPPYAAVVVKPDKLELRQHIVFEWDSLKLEAASYPLLDEVVVALQHNRAVKVAIEGHASSDGAEPHNQTLSRGRADAVRDYLVSRGVAADRLIATGLSSSAPSEGNDTRGGRAANRRVEFVVSFIIVQEGNTP